MHVERHADFMRTIVPYLEAPWTEKAYLSSKQIPFVSLCWPYSRSPRRGDQIFRVYEVGYDSEKEEDEIPLLSVLKEKLKKSVFWGYGLSPIAKKILTSILAAVRFLALQLYLKFLQSYSCNLLLLSFVTEHETKLFFEFNATPYVENQISEMGVYILSFLAWV